MASVCGAYHPKERSRTCILTGSGHGEHQDGRGLWPNEDRQQEVASQRAQTGRGKKGNRALLIEMSGKVAAGINEHRRNERRQHLVSVGVPLDAVEAWSKEEWQSYAEGVFLDFLRGRQEPFTTPEHLWPLLLNPRERRSLVLVVKKMVGQKNMEEVSATRLRGVYHTLDGVEFTMNKLVPVYRSMIAVH